MILKNLWFLPSFEIGRMLERKKKSVGDFCGKNELVTSLYNKIKIWCIDLLMSSLISLEKMYKGVVWLLVRFKLEKKEKKKTMPHLMHCLKISSNSLYIVCLGIKLIKNKF